MATKPAFERWTYERFARLPHEDGKRREVIAGELFVSPTPSIPHQELVGRLHLLLRPFVDAHELGRVILSPAAVLFAAGDYLIPDLFFVRAGRSGIVSRRGVEGAPDLVVEVLSPSTRLRDLGIKRDRYAHFGVPHYWILDPRKRQVQIYRLHDGADAPTVVSTGSFDWQPVPDGPALQIDVEALFRDVD
jgi:Uma2 family endonuclease